MFARLMHADRVETHLITSEWPRDHGEVRTLVGRIVGDRAIGRFVFGDVTEEQRVKVMGLSSRVDVVLDAFVYEVGLMRVLVWVRVIGKTGTGVVRCMSSLRGNLLGQSEFALCSPFRCSMSYSNS